MRAASSVSSVSPWPRPCCRGRKPHSISTRPRSSVMGALHCTTIVSAPGRHREARRPHREPVCARAMTIATRRGMAVCRDAGAVRTAISMSGGVGGLEAEKGFVHHGGAPAGRGEGPGPGCMMLHVGPIEVHMNAFITPRWVEKPRLSPARELAGESILT